MRSLFATMCSTLATISYIVYYTSYLRVLHVLSNVFCVFAANGSFSALDQPDIEFMLTDIYQFNQTGKRQLKGLFQEVMKFRQPSEVTYGGGISLLFGRELQIEYEKTILLDVTDESLSVGGWLSVEEFTIGTYIWMPDKDFYFDIWYLLTDHGQQVNYLDKFKFMLWAERTNEITGIYFGYKHYLQGNDWYTLTTELGEWGWIHVAYTYDPNESGGKLRVYINGQSTDEFLISFSSNQIGSMYANIQALP